MVMATATDPAMVTATNGDGDCDGNSDGNDDKLNVKFNK
jgi:hypothetical protein